MSLHKLMSLEDYRKVVHKNPYLIELQKGSQFLYFFGSEHTTDMNHTQFELLNSFWTKFVTKVTSDKVFVFVEGNLRALQTTPLEAIKKSGEAGLVTYLANQAQFPIICPEPSITEISLELAKTFSKDEIFYFYFVNKLKPLYRRVENISDEQLTDIVTKLSSQLNFVDVTFSLYDIYRIHLEKFNSEFDVNAKDFMSNLSMPFPELGSFTNKIAYIRDNYRNDYIFRQIKNYWESGNSLFIVYGSAHAVMMEDALKNLVKS